MTTARILRLWTAALASTALLAVAVTPAGAASNKPGWTVQSIAEPSVFSVTNNENCELAEAKCDAYALTATNVGTRSSEGTIVIKGTIPAGLTLRTIRGLVPGLGGEEGPEMACENTGNDFQCSTSSVIRPGAIVSVLAGVLVEGGAQSTVVDTAEVLEGATPVAATSEPTTVPNAVNGPDPGFGFEAFGLAAFDAAGAPDSRAGDHPGAVTATIDYKTAMAPATSAETFVAAEEPKTAIVNLPLGVVGDTLAADQCPESQLNGGAEENLCPQGSQIGLVAVNYNGATVSHLFKLYNMAPEPGYPAVFGFHVSEIPILMRARVLPSASGYYLSIAVPDIPRSAYLKITGVSLTLFGNPSEQDGIGNSAKPTGFVTNPSNCSSGPLRGSVEMNSWVNPSRWVAQEATMYEASPTQGVSGCRLLEFGSTIAVAPESTQADTPSGYEVDLKVPQAPELFGALATPDLRNAELTLPEGVALSPGAADGLVSCKATGPEGIELGSGDAVSHDLQEGETEGTDGLVHPSPGHCPSASAIGTVEVKTPLLAEPLHGHIFTAEPLCGGSGQPACSDAEAAAGNIFRLYLEAEGSGVIVKLEGRARANPTSGQLTVTFKENPQFPFEELKVQLKGGPRAPLANPQSCGAATTTSLLEPWSAPESGPAATPTSSFGVTGCGSAMPFSPGFLAQTAEPTAGGFSPFTVTLSRHDGEQNIGAVSVATPPGLLGMLSKVQLCPEAQAASGTCGPESLIGHSQVGAGSGSHPFYEPGEVFLTGPYHGQPFGLSIVTHAVAGPYNLGTIVVRASIHVDPTTAALTVASDPLPRIIDGVPLRIQAINVAIDKPGFIFNPTNCNQQAVTGTIAGAQPSGAPGSGATVSTRFSATGCKNLPFKPTFSALSEAKTSKANGAYLHVKITSGAGQANIAQVKTDLPLQLPSRLTTLQKACLAATFEANPASCPSGSLVGKASATTPALKSQLTGPAYLVSHGNAAFPDLEIVLQGEGITLILDGNTDIKKGITSSFFKTVPDAPVSSFDLVLPTGPRSLLAANGSLCAKPLAMPTKITGQNGAVVKQTTKIAVSGCPKKHQKKKKHKKKRPAHPVAKRKH